MSERLAPPFEVVSKLDSFIDTDGYRINLVDANGKLIRTDDPRFIALEINISELKVEHPSTERKSIAFSLPNRKSKLLVNIDPDFQTEIKVDYDGEIITAYEVGPQADFWFKEPCAYFITLKFNKEMRPILQERRFKNDTEGIKVVAIPII